MRRGKAVKTPVRQRHSVGTCPDTGNVRWVVLSPGVQLLITINREWQLELGRFEAHQVSIGVCCHGGKAKVVLVSDAFLLADEGMFLKKTFKTLAEFQAKVKKWWAQSAQRGEPRPSKILVTPENNHNLTFGLKLG